LGRRGKLVCRGESQGVFRGTEEECSRPLGGWRRRGRGGGEIFREKKCLYSVLGGMEAGGRVARAGNRDDGHIATQLMVRGEAFENLKTPGKGRESKNCCARVDIRGNTADANLTEVERENQARNRREIALRRGREKGRAKRRASPDPGSRWKKEKGLEDSESREPGLRLCRGERGLRSLAPIVRSAERARMRSA